jgi:hypothetical protein
VDDLEVVVERSRWLRGNGMGCLRNNFGMQCCLGFACEAAGETGSMLNLPAPIDLLSDNYSAPEHLLRFLDCFNGYYFNNATVDALVEANDVENVSDSVREKQIIALGREIGINFTFVD